MNVDSAQVLTLTGRIIELDIRNPHSQLTLQVTQPDGTVKEWTPEEPNYKRFRERARQK